MCASYGLDPRFDDREFRAAMDAETLEGLHIWATRNEGEIQRPTGRHLRNLNPIIRTPQSIELAWWGYLVNGAPARFASINTRSERLASQREALPQRAIVPVSFWREMAGPSRAWHHYTAPDDGLIGLAAVTRPGRTADGVEVTCYSILMQPAAPHLADVHERMPVLIAPRFAEEWMLTTDARGDLITAAIAAAEPVVDSIRVAAEVADDPNRLF